MKKEPLTCEQLNWPCQLNSEFKQRLLALARPGQGLVNLELFTGRCRLPGVIYFLRGRLHLYLATTQTRSFAGAVFGTGDWLGAMAVAGQNQTAYVVAEEAEPIEYLLFPTESLQALAQQEEELYKWLYFMVAEIQPKWLQASITSFHDIEARLTYSLLQLLAKNPPPRGVLPQVRIAQEQLAQLAGISRPRLNEVLKQLEAVGELELQRGCIRVLDLPALCRRLHCPVLSVSDLRQCEPLTALLNRPS